MERAGVAGGEEGGVVAAEQTDVSRDVGGDDRQAGHHRLGDDVRTAFHDRAHHHRVAAREGAADLPPRYLASPDVARVGGHLGAGFPRVGRVVRLAEVDDAQLRRGRGEPRRAGRTERILLLAQVPDDADVEGTPRGPPGGAQRQRGLTNDPEPGPERRRQVVRHGVVQAHEPVRGGHRRGGLLGMAVQEAVDVGAGHEHHERAAGITGPGTRLPRPRFARRGIATRRSGLRARPASGRSTSACASAALPPRRRLAGLPSSRLRLPKPRFGHRHRISERLQDAAPAHRGRPVAAARAFRGRGDHADVQSCLRAVAHGVLAGASPISPAGISVGIPPGGGYPRAGRPVPIPERVRPRRRPDRRPPSSPWPQ